MNLIWSLSLLLELSLLLVV
ncbi:hypothetical protein RDABS01_020898 [Bienertia sinuspersici]